MNRNCVACGQVDDHPRHITIIDDLQEAPFHMDCHARMGCQICTDSIAGANGATGDDLRLHLITLGQ